MNRFVPLVFAATACTAGQVTLDATHPLSLSVGAEGGTISAEGVQIDVPAGAVDANVTITAYPKDRVVDGLTTASQAWTFGPDGQIFNVPITVHLAFANLDKNATVWWTKAGDHNTFTPLQTTMKDGWAVAKVTHFSEGVVGEDACGGATADDEAQDSDAHDGEDDTDADAGEHGGAEDTDADAGEQGEHDGDHEHADEPHGTCEDGEHHGGDAEGEDSDGAGEDTSDVDQ